MAIIKTPAAVDSPYQTTDTAPTVLRASADGTTVLAAAAAATTTTSTAADANANVSYYATGVEGIAGLANQGRVFDGANVYVTLDQQNFNTTNRIDNPAGSNGYVQFNNGGILGGSVNLAFDGANLLTGGIKTDNYYYANGSPFSGGGGSSYGNANVVALLSAFGSNTLFTTGNVTSGNLITSGLISTTGNVVGNNIIGAAANIPSVVSQNLDVENISARIGNNGVNIGAGGYNNLVVLPTEVLIQNVPLTVAGNIVANQANGLYITANTVANGTAQIWNFGTDGRLTFPGTPVIDTDASNFDVLGAESISLEANANVNIYTDTGNSVYQWTFDNTGNLTMPGSIILPPGAVLTGTGASPAPSINGFSTASFGSDISSFANITGGNLLANTNVHVAATNGNLVLGDATATNSPGLSSTTSLTITANRAGSAPVWVFGNDGSLAGSGNISGGNVNTGIVSATGNVIGGNITGGNISAVGNVNSDTVTAVTLSAVGNIIANNAMITQRVSGANLEITGTANVGNLSTTGTVSANGNVTTLTTFYAGNGATWQSQVAFANVLFVGADVGEAYIQAAIVETGGNGSADWVSYSNNGNTDSGWIDMGITGNTFNDPDYEITDPNDGYILVEGTNVSGTPLGGNLILATGTTGLAHDIVFATGGFTHANIKARLVDTTGEFSVVGNIVANNLSGTNLVINSITSDDSTFVTVEDGLNVVGDVDLSGNVTANNISLTGNVTGGNITTAGNITGNTAGFAIGYLNIPQVAFTGDATIAATDAGKHYYSTVSTANVLTIANNTSVSWAVGTAISLVNRGTGNITVAQGSGVSLYLAGNATAGNRTVATYGMATLMNVAANVWMINGTGVS